MGTKALMLALPEVKHLVDRIPIARVVLKPTAVHLRFCQHARDTRMPLKEQCRALDIPWHARRVPAEAVSKTMLKAARSLPPTVFVQCLPADDAERWASIVRQAEGMALRSQQWLARNALKLGDNQYSCIAYLRETPSLPLQMSVEKLVEKAQEAEVRRRAEHNRQWNRMMTQLMNGDLYAPYLLNWRGEPAGNDTSDIQCPQDWLAPFHHGSLTITLLNTHEQFAREGEVMQNCVLRDYWSKAKRGICRIASVTRGDRHIATAEFTADWELIQAKAPKNNDLLDEEAITALRAFGARFTEAAE